VFLDNIMWEMEESLRQAHRDRSVPRFTYGRGQLEIMRLAIEHEELQDTVALLVHTLAAEMRLNTEYRNFRRYFATVLGERGHGEARSPTTAAARTTRSGYSGEVVRTACFLRCTV
jgi:hypothetical protein